LNKVQRPKNPDSSAIGSRRGGKTSQEMNEIMTDLVPHLSDISHEVTIKLKESSTDIDISNKSPSKFIDDMGIKT
jgi:hypothetical protein